MYTFQLMYEEAQAQCQDSSAATLVLIKRALNQGLQKFAGILNREFRVIEREFDVEGGEQWYQMPEDCIRPQAITLTIGGHEYPLTEIVDDAKWRELNRGTPASGFPEFFYVKGSDQFGVWPIPSEDVEDGGLIEFEPRMKRMAAADYVTGSITLTAESQNVVGSGGAAWTAKMVGRTLVAEDEGDLDGIAHKIVGFTDATHIALENFWSGDNLTTSSYRIGDVPDIPEEYHEALIDYALYRVYKRRKDRAMAKDSLDAFKESLEDCRESYSSSTSSQYIPPVRLRRAGYLHGHRDLSVSGS